MGIIKKPAEIEILPTVKMMVYGQAGAGKTTLALSAPKPLLLDFDNGVRRVSMSCLDGVDIVQVGKWGDIEELLREHADELAVYETIVVDTVGKMVDFIITGVCGERQPQIKDWGKVNKEFQWFCRQMGDLRKNIIFVAHRDTRKEGEETVFVPSLREKNYNAIVTELDLLGYLEMRTERGTATRTITFDPTARNDGKNTCGLPSAMRIPEVLSRDDKKTADNDFISREVIAPYGRMLEEKARLHREHAALMERIEAEIASLSSAQDANAYVGKLKAKKHVGNSMEKARAMFARKVKELGLAYDAAAKKYTDAKTEV